MELTESARDLFLPASDEAASIDPKFRRFLEVLTFADIEDILTMLNEVQSVEFMEPPVWVRNLAYRLACLQRPNDPQLLKEAADKMYFFGPDWDHVAHELYNRVEELDPSLARHRPDAP